jgi:hypothetical protein
MGRFFDAWPLIGPLWPRPGPDFIVAGTKRGSVLRNQLGVSLMSVALPFLTAVTRPAAIHL